MAVFAYTARNEAAKVVRGTVVAETPRQARDSLRARGWTVQDVGAYSAAPRSARFRRTNRHSASMVCFVRELATLLGVGIPLLEAIDTLERQYSGGFRSALLLLRDRVSSGQSLAEAMRQQPEIFDDLTIAIIEVGESAGTLETSLERLAEFKERSAAVKNKVATALLYPAIVLTLALAVGLFLMTFVVPKLLGGLLQAGRPIPLPTRIVKGISDFLIGWWWAVLIGVGAIGAGFAAALSTPRGRLHWHRFQLRLPGLGNLIRKQSIGRIAIVISTLIRSGVPFVRALQIAQRSTRNLVLRKALTECESAIIAGQNIAEALEETGAFPPMVVQIFAVGQQSGRMEEMLDRLAHDYNQQVTSATNRLIAVLEPAMILVLVILVGAIAFATVLPILEAANVL